MKAYLKSNVIDYMQWHGNASDIKQFEEFIKQYNNYSFEYTTAGGWIIRWSQSYRTLHVDDVIIIGYKDLVIIGSAEFDSKYKEV